MSISPFLTILTPTYNRGHLLGNCFASLQSQTDHDFEWFIVDDGSTDNTSHVVSQFQTDLFPVWYLQKENGGKHTALNEALPHIRGKYVLILDSDDRLTRDAVSRIHALWKTYEDDPSVAVITFLKGASREEPNCTASVTHEAVDYFHCKRHIRRSCDCCEVIRADVMKSFPFPVFAGETFLSEAALWFRVAIEYQYVYSNEVLYLCQYLEDGLTCSGRSLHLRNPKGGMYCAELAMHPKNRLSLRIKNGILFCCYGFFAGLSVRQILKQAKSHPISFLWLVPGWLLHCYWDRKYLRASQ